MTHQNPNPQPEYERGPAAKSKYRRGEPKRFVIEYRGGFFPGKRDWRVMGRYTTAAIRDQALDQFARKYSFYEYRTIDLPE